ncbi:hypothetical protein H2200_010333 [Cladophialophora chaetospira]|uniref:SnoaL-like domain-containing protein n=1 Tax=Cladophialophora chaetospira TaxID=386627 RepID=A0AA38X1A1_9EURO|nr:hypothetical protein H2200_010333 [Cladophialophora chaetospira]
MPPTRAELLHTAKNLFVTYNKWNVEDIMAIRTSDCTHRVLPSSLGQAPLDNDAFRRFVENLMLGIPKGFNFTIDEKTPLVDESARKVVVFAKSKAETVAGPYANEYIFVVTVDESGNKIAGVEEFVDATIVKDFLPKFEEAMAKLA